MSDGNSQGKKTILYAQELTADGHATAGPRQKVLENDEPWEGDVAGPHGGTYLVYAAHHVDGGDNLKADRSILVDEITDWSGGWRHVTHDAPTISSQAMP